MPIPEFNEIKAPALQFFADSKPHKVSEVFAILGNHFKLTEDERNELLPSGTQRRWHNRANWACYDLFRAGLLDRPKKGLYIITELGRKIAEQKPKLLDRDFLMQFPQFAQFVQASGPKKGNQNPQQVNHL
jgi:restriction system protein